MFYDRKLGRQQPEQALQRALVEYLDLALPDDALCFAIPNGGKRSKVVAALLKMTGVKAGIPDLCIVWRGRAIFMELKAARGYLSAEQRAMHAKLTFCGCEVWTVRSIEQAEYLLRSLQMPLQAALAA